MTQWTDPTPGAADPTRSSSEGTMTSQAAGQVREQAQEVVSQAQERAQQMGQQAQGRMRQEVDSRSTQAGEAVVSTSQDLHSVADALREQGKETPAKLADQAAQQLERMGSYLRDADGDRILGDVEGFVRRQPWVVAGAGLMLGFVAARLLKASASDRYRRSVGDERDYALPRAGETTYTRSSYDYDVGAAATTPPPVAPEATTTEVGFADVPPRSTPSVEPVGTLGVDESTRYDDAARYDPAPPPPRDESLDDLSDERGTRP